MAVTLNRTGSTLTVAVTVDVADLIAAVQAGTTPAPEAKLVALRRAVRQLADAAEVATRTDAQLDANAAAAVAEATRLKALRPTGAF